jgi:membrane-associated protein
MPQALAGLLERYLTEYGYLTLALSLLLENAGVPVPGETVLLLASFLAFSSGHLRLPLIIVIGSLAATAGDNIGYAIGRWGGRRLLRRFSGRWFLSRTAVVRGEALFARFGPEAVFVARFVFGLRVIAGPLAGVLNMPWRRFLIFNALGAVSWVSVIAAVGYLFGREWRRVVPYLQGIHVVLVVVLVAVGIVLYFRMRRSETR